MTVMTAPARTETVTGTITASHQGVAGAVVGVVAVDEAVAGTETESAGVATRATGPHRYGNTLLPFSPSLLSIAPNQKGV